MADQSEKKGGSSLFSKGAEFMSLLGQLAKDEVKQGLQEVEDLLDKGISELKEEVEKRKKKEEPASTGS